MENTSVNQHSNKTDWPAPDGRHAFTSEELLYSVTGESSNPTVCCNRGDPLEVIANAGGIKVYKDEQGRFYLDYPVGLSTRKFSKAAEYSVQRRREQVTAKFALQKLLSAVVPPELLTLLPFDAWVVSTE